jgi:hypothetical protein
MIKVMNLVSTNGEFRAVQFHDLTEIYGAVVQEKMTLT